MSENNQIQVKIVMILVSIMLRCCQELPFKEHSKSEVTYIEVSGKRTGS